MTRFVVVLFSWSPCDVYPDARCVMEAHGPFTLDEAEAFMAAEHGWSAPHLVALTEPETPA